jgi:hypothetical protein
MPLVEHHAGPLLGHEYGLEWVLAGLRADLLLHATELIQAIRSAHPDGHELSPVMIGIDKDKNVRGLRAQLDGAPWRTYILVEP